MVDGPSPVDPISEILKRLSDLEQENEKLRTLVESRRITIERVNYGINDPKKAVYHYFIGGMQYYKIEEVRYPKDHRERYGINYPEHGYQIEYTINPQCNYIHPEVKDQINCMRNITFVSFSAAEEFIKGTFTGYSGDVVIVDISKKK